MTEGAGASFATVAVRRHHQLDCPSRWSEAARLTILGEQRVHLQVTAFLLACSRAREEERVQRQLPIALDAAHLVSKSGCARKTGKSCRRSGASFISASRPGIEGPCAPP